MTTSAVPTNQAAGAVAPRAAVAMFGLLLLAYSVNAMDRMVFPVLLPDVSVEYGFTLGQSGLQATMFALGMGITGIPAGLLAGTIGRYCKAAIAAHEKTPPAAL